MQRALLPCVLAVAAVTLCSCGGANKGLIPLANAGPLERDFEAVAAAAKHGKGDCTETQQAIAKTRRDFAALPQGVDRGLRAKLSEGIENLTSISLELCEQPAVTKTSTETTETGELSETSTSTTHTTEPEEPEETEEETETLSSSTYTPPEEENYEATGGEQAPPEGPQGVGPTGEGPPGHYEDGGVP